MLLQDYFQCSHTKCLKVNSFTTNCELEQANDSNSVKLKSNNHNDDDNNNNDDDNNNNDDNNNKQQ